MAKANAAKQDQETLREAGDALKRHGVTVTNATEVSRPPGQNLEKDSFEQRARVKDLSQDQGKKPEGVHQQTGWADRVMASHAQTQGRSRGGTSNDNRSAEPANAATKGKGEHGQAAGKQSSEPTSWADRVIASRPPGYGHGKVDTPENAPTAEKGKEQEAAPEKARGKEAKPQQAKFQGAKPKGQEKSQAKQHEHEHER